MTEIISGHKCRFREERKATDWKEKGRLLEREWTPHFICRDCGIERPARRVRAPDRLEQKLHGRPIIPDDDSAGQKVAGGLLKRVTPSKNKVVYRQGVVGGPGIKGTLAEEWIIRFLDAGWVHLTWRLEGTRRKLEIIEVEDIESLREYSVPGLHAARERALDEARKAVQGRSHPVAIEVASVLLSSDANQLEPIVIKALAAIAVHVESGEVLAERVFSTKYLSDSKVLASIRNRLENIVGPLDAIGIREVASYILVAGNGSLVTEQVKINLSEFKPFIGIPREMAETIKHIDMPSEGIIVIENFTVFEAACKGEVKEIQDSLIVWSAGYPGRAVKAIIKQALINGGKVRVWADLDLDGIKIARLVASWNPSGVEPYRMGPNEVGQAKAWTPLGERQAKVIKKDLEQNPNALLASTLRALLEFHRWVEQESQLG